MEHDPSVTTNLLHFCILCLEMVEKKDQHIIPVQEKNKFILLFIFNINKDFSYSFIINRSSYNISLLLLV